EYAGGTASHVGQVDAVRRGREMFVLDYFEIGEVVDQREEMLASAADVRSIVAVLVGQWPGELRADRLCIGDDPGDRLAQHRRDLASYRGADDGPVRLRQGLRFRNCL